MALRNHREVSFREGKIYLADRVICDLSKFEPVEQLFQKIEVNMEGSTGVERYKVYGIMEEWAKHLMGQIANEHLLLEFENKMKL